MGSKRVGVSFLLWNQLLTGDLPRSTYDVLGNCRQFCLLCCYRVVGARPSECRTETIHGRMFPFRTDSGTWRRRACYGIRVALDGSGLPDVFDDFPAGNRIAISTMQSSKASHTPDGHKLSFRFGGGLILATGPAVSHMDEKPTFPFDGGEVLRCLLAVRRSATIAPLPGGYVSQDVLLV